MIRIDLPYGDYQDNLISEDFLLENGKNWQFSVGGGANTSVSLSTEESFVKEHSIKIVNNNYNFTDITIEPANTLDYKITITKTGYYNFCLRTLLKAIAPHLPELIGGVSIYKNGEGSPTYTSSLSIGNNSLPEFSYYYNKWNLYYDKFYFTINDIITIKLHITSDPSFLANSFILFLDGFQLNYMNNRINTIPSLYVKP